MYQTPSQKHDLLMEKIEMVKESASKKDDIRQYLQYGSTKIRGSKMDFIFAFVDDGSGNALPLGFVSFQDGEIGIIYTTDDMRRNGIAKEMLKIADKVAGKTLVDDGDITKDGVKLMKGLKRPVSKGASKPSNGNHMKRNISMVMLNMIGAPVSTFKILKKVKKFKLPS